MFHLLFCQQTKKPTSHDEVGSSVHSQRNVSEYLVSLSTYWEEPLAIYVTIFFLQQQKSISHLL